MIKCAVHPICVLANGHFGACDDNKAIVPELQNSIPMRIPCPDCGELHIDEGEFKTKAHHTHSCQMCGLTWRPAIVCTVGVRFLPGFKNENAITP